jgi:hypothetical protein
MYKAVGNTIVEVPQQFIRITLVPIENEKDILWKNDWILTKANKSLKKLLFSLWIPSMYLDSRTKKQNDELLVMLNGGRSSDIIIPTLTAEYGDIKYNLNILNCKGTGRPEILENPQAHVKRVSNFSIGNTVISRFEFYCGRPIGGVTVKDALKEEVVNEEMMLREGLPHTPHALVLRIPKSIQRRIDKYNSQHVYRYFYHIYRYPDEWINGDFAQVKRFFTTNIRMINDSSELLPEQKDFFEYVVEKNNKPEWIKPENLAKLLGRVDGRYQAFFKKMEIKGKCVDFTGDTGANRTLDGLLTDGENLKIIPNDRLGMEEDMFYDSIRFLEDYAKLYNKTPRETKRIIKSYEEAKREEIEHRKPISIPPENSFL